MAIAPSHIAKPVDRIGPWQLVRLIGEGAWTRVYQARPISSSGGNRPADYAVKVLKPQWARDPLAVRMLQREDRIGRHVSHPNLSPVLASRIDRAPFYLTTPLIVGTTVERWLGDHSAAEALVDETYGPSEICASRYSRRMTALPLGLTPPVALWIVRQAAEALAALHAAGWTHGDVKPGNLLVSPSGHVTLIDLGFARRIDLEIDPHAALEDAELCAASPAYAAPELQDDGAKIDGSADTYSLGVTLFELLARRRPFAEHDPRQLAVAHRHQPPPDLTEVVPGISRSLARFVARMLSKEPSQRPDDIQLVRRLMDFEINTFHLR